MTFLVRIFVAWFPFAIAVAHARLLGVELVTTSLGQYVHVRLNQT